MEAKSITKEQFKEFYNKYENLFISVCYNEYHNFYNVLMPLEFENEVLSYWSEKGYTTFLNLTITFKI